MGHKITDVEKDAIINEARLGRKPFLKQAIYAQIVGGKDLNAKHNRRLLFDDVETLINCNIINTRRKAVGVLLGQKIGDNLFFGFSFMSPKDLYLENEETGFAIAYKRLTDNIANNVTGFNYPEKFQHDVKTFIGLNQEADNCEVYYLCYTIAEQVKRFTDRCARYFHTDTKDVTDK